MLSRFTLITFSLLLAVGCGKKSEPTSSNSSGSEPTSSSSGSGNSFPPAFTESFMKGCVSTASANEAVSDDMAQRYCKCALGEVEANFTIKQVMEAMEKSGGDVPEEMVAVMEPCVKKILGEASGGGGSEKAKDPATGGGAYPAAVRDAYLKSCVGGASSMGDKAKPYCSCTLKKIEAKYSLDEFVKLANKMQGGDLPDEFMSIVKSCL